MWPDARCVTAYGTLFNEWNYVNLVENFEIIQCKIVIWFISRYQIALAMEWVQHRRQNVSIMWTLTNLIVLKFVTDTENL